MSELAVRLPDEFTILSGDDSLTLPFLCGRRGRRGERGFQSFSCRSGANGEPFLEGKAEEARRLHQKFFPLFKDAFIEPNPVPAKTALAWRGMMSADCRLPLVAMTAANAERLRQTLAKLES